MNGLVLTYWTYVPTWLIIVLSKVYLGVWRKWWFDISEWSLWSISVNCGPKRDVATSFNILSSNFDHFKKLVLGGTRPPIPRGYATDSCKTTYMIYVSLLFCFVFCKPNTDKRIMLLTLNHESFVSSAACMLLDLLSDVVNLIFFESALVYTLVDAAAA